ncbi:DUF3970 family protein [Sphaerospermopsis aphanizomenoides BCCUSP55]|uniref:DUF3970 family protein n=1 Tax=Sphaerospermopsis aphanizomenoides TaxID=459663 RepID=UPI001905ED43|nr:DUF3970 family protein [Sphaerospermopsis aphanizomenoides]MBK1990870.1 DUF3970 family protein [Sphaerospermopsis aphanizomenoides BCCUSP55]
MKCRLIASSEEEIKEMVALLRMNEFLVANLTIKESSNPKYSKSGNILAYFDLGVN